jgi:23S rRNA pseudouridine2604 synthase
MAELGLCSRREADDWIAQGLGQGQWQGGRNGPAGARRRTASPCKIAAGQQDSRVTILLNKPIGYVSARPRTGMSPPWR